MIDHVAPVSAAPVSAPVALTDIRIEGSVLGNDVDAVFAPHSADAGQWIVLAGSQSAVVLNAVMAALSTSGTAHRHLSGVLAPPLLSRHPRAPKATKIMVGIAGAAEPVIATVRHDHRGTAVEHWDPECSPGIRPIYCPPIPGRYAPEAYSTLVTGPSEAERVALRSTGPKGWWPWDAARTIVRLLSGQDVRGVDGSDVDWGVLQIQTSGRTLPLTALDDGALTLVSRALSILWRWAEANAASLGDNPPPNVLGQMTGLVLIDTIDLCLWPVQQATVIEKLRGVFPRMSFIVTTGSPLVLLGARSGEVHVLRGAGRGADGRRVGPLELTQLDVRPGDDADRVLYSHFGIECALGSMGSKP